MKSLPEIVHDNNPKVFELVFRETVAYHFFVKAPDRKAASLWAEKNGTKAVNANIGRQIVEERGCEELFENHGAVAEFEVNSKGNKLPKLPKKRKKKGGKR